MVTYSDARIEFAGCALVTLNHTLEVRVRCPNELPLSERNPATDFAILLPLAISNLGR